MLANYHARLSVSGGGYHAARLAHYSLKLTNIIIKLNRIPLLSVRGVTVMIIKGNGTRKGGAEMPLWRGVTFH